MAVFIYEDDAFDKMVEVEGPDYIEHKEDFGICSFAAFKKEWEKYFEKNLRRRNAKEFYLEIEGNPAIYGIVGLNRYYVLNTGEIVFSPVQAITPEYIERAKEIGFRIWPK